jgi:hypothetical protein
MRALDLAISGKLYDWMWKGLAWLICTKLGGHCLPNSAGLAHGITYYEISVGHI